MKVNWNLFAIIIVTFGYGQTQKKNLLVIEQLWSPHE